MKIIYKYPTRQRPLKFLKCISSYYSLMNGGDYEIVLSIDNDDELMTSPEVSKHIESMENLIVCVGNSKTKIEAINADVPDTNWDILVLISDDMIPEVNGFDDIIREDMSRLYPDTDGVLWYFDGWRRDLNTLCIIGRKYYDRFKYIYHPAYKSFWCDMEFTDVANSLGKQTFIDLTIIRHLHPDIVMQNEKAKKAFSITFPEFAQQRNCGHDELWQKNSLPGDPDKAVYDFRKSNNFDLGNSIKIGELK